MAFRFPIPPKFKILLLGILLIGSGAVIAWKLFPRFKYSRSLTFQEKAIPVDTFSIEENVELFYRKDSSLKIISESEKQEIYQVKTKLDAEPDEITETTAPLVKADTGLVVSDRTDQSPDTEKKIAKFLPEAQEEMAFSYKMGNPLKSDTIILPVDSTDDFAESVTVIQELCDGINVALVRENIDSLRTTPPVYQYLETFNEAILRKFNSFSYKSLADFKTGSRVAYSDYLFQSGDKLIKVRMIAFEEFDKRDAVFLPEAFCVNIVSWKDDVIEMDWFINAGILEIPPEKIEIGVSGKQYIEIVFGKEAVYEIDSAN